VSVLLYLFVAVAISAAGSLVLWMRARQPTSMDAGIDQFRRELQALAPERPPLRRDDSAGDDRAG
jgi:hypothetical protein